MSQPKTNQTSWRAKRTRLANSLALTLLGSAVFHSAAFAQAPGTPAQTMHLPYSQFKIPFSVDARGTQPTQVQLWVSTDQGASWQMQGLAPSAQKHFDFRAAGEGLYLFSVQTLDENGKAFPSPQPPLRIMIDTTKPQVALRADVNASGQVVVDIRIDEEHLKTDSVRLRYRTDQDNEWREVEVTNIVAAEQIYEGQVTLDLKNNREVGFVITVADEAANVGEASTQYVMPRTAWAPQDMKLASQRNGSGQSTQQGGVAPMPGAVAWPNPQGTNPQGTNAQGTNAQGPNAAASSSGPVAHMQAPQNQLLQNHASRQPGYATKLHPTAPPATSSPNAPTASQLPSSGSQPGGWSVSGQLASRGELSLNPAASVGQNPAFSTPQDAAASSPLGTALLMPGAEELPAPRPIEGNLPTKAMQPHLVDKQDFQAQDQPAQANESVAKRPAEKPQSFDNEIDRTPVGQAFHCNSRSFSLDYSLNPAAGSGLAEVELWGTEDGGSTWEKWGADPDRQSPFDIQVANDGMFGFRMVIVSKNGKVTNRPKGGDSGDAWINVDTNQPVAKITRAVYGDGHEAGMLVIDYNCTDENLHDRPISLSYSEMQSGPWVTIATGLKNTGIYLWKADANLPENIFLRLESVDKAGNMGRHVLDLPINVQGLMPRGRIQGFRPIVNPE